MTITSVDTVARLISYIRSMVASATTIDLVSHKIEVFGRVIITKLYTFRRKVILQTYRRILRLETFRRIFKLWMDRGDDNN